MDLRRRRADRDARLRGDAGAVRDAPSQAVAELIPEFADDIAKYRVAEPEPLRTRVDGLES